MPSLFQSPFALCQEHLQEVTCPLVFVGSQEGVVHNGDNEQQMPTIPTQLRPHLEIVGVSGFTPFVRKEPQAIPFADAYRSFP